MNIIGFKKEQSLIILFAILFLALIVRFWWFPENVYFGFDQDRDAFISQGIYQNRDIKIIGPSAGKEGLFHGPLYWYLIGPVYLIFKGNPVWVLAFISFINASGIFLIYLMGKNLFGKNFGLLASLLYAFSFSQTQYALYFANPSLAVLTMMLFYLGWIYLIFKKKSWAWVLIFLGLGFSIQFQFFLICLWLTFLLMVIVFWKEVKSSFKFRYFSFGLIGLFASLSTFILAEIKYGFRTLKTLFSTFLLRSIKLFLFKRTTPETVKLATSTFWERLGDEALYNIFGFFPRIRIWLAVFIILLILFFSLKDKKYRKQFLFLFVWIVSNYSLDLFGPPQLYYVGIGLSPAIILTFAYMLKKLFVFRKYLAIIFIGIILLSNLNLIKKFNPKGPINSLYVQEGMLLEKERELIDWIYKDSQGKKFVVNALTMPYKIRTTWDYLFTWDGKKKYGYVPFWGGEDVPGYPGKMSMPDSLKYLRYSIFEPTRGIPEGLKKEFIDSENGYGLPVFEKKIGNFLVQKRIPE